MPTPSTLYDFFVMITKRLNLTTYHHVFAELSTLQKNFIITSLFECSIADMGFHITLTGFDPSKFHIENMSDMRKVISDMTYYNLVEYYPPSYCISVTQLANLVYQLTISEV